MRFRHRYLVLGEICETPKAASLRATHMGLPVNALIVLCSYCERPRSYPRNGSDTLSGRCTRFLRLQLYDTWRDFRLVAGYSSHGAPYVFSRGFLYFQMAFLPQF